MLNSSKNILVDILNFFNKYAMIDIDEDKVNDISNGLREIYWEEIRQKDRDAGWIDEFIQDQFQLDDREFLRASQMLRQTIRERNSQNIRKKRKKEWDWD